MGRKETFTECLLYTKHCMHGCSMYVCHLNSSLLKTLEGTMIHSQFIEEETPTK
jgi:hypothetical protein